jgi:hypothetical protein
VNVRSWGRGAIHSASTGGSVKETKIRSFALAGEGFRVGRVLSNSLILLLGGFPKYYAFGAVAALPHLVNALYGYEFLRILDRLPRFALTIVNIGFMFLEMILLSVCEATLIYGVLQNIRGGPFNVGVSIHRALSRLIPVIGTAVCTFALVAIGFVLFAVPGFIFLTMYFVVIPVCVAESLGPTQSLGRSRELTKGYRWQIFAIYLVPAIVLGLCHVLLQRLGIRYGGIIGYAAGIFLLSSIGGTYRMILDIVTYHDLRSAKEGLDIEHLAAVFD